MTPEHPLLEHCNVIHVSKPALAIAPLFMQAACQRMEHEKRPGDQSGFRRSRRPIFGNTMCASVTPAPACHQSSKCREDEIHNFTFISFNITSALCLGQVPAGTAEPAQQAHFLHLPPEHWHLLLRHGGVYYHTCAKVIDADLCLLCNLAQAAVCPSNDQCLARRRTS